MQPVLFLEHATQPAVFELAKWCSPSKMVEPGVNSIIRKVCQEF